MAKPINFTEQQIESLYETFKVGLSHVESGGNYSAKNDVVNATGKYQFVPAHWWTQPGSKVLKIKEFAEKHKDLFGEVKSMEDFRNNPQLQEAYFAYYTKNFLIPEAQKIANNSDNPGNFNFLQIGMLVHFKGAGGAAKWVREGRMPDAVYGKEGKNKGKKLDLEGDKYWERFENAVKNNLSAEHKAVISQVSDINSIKNNPFANRGRAVYEFQKRNKAIDDLDLPQVEKEALRRDMFLDVLESGNHDLIDIYQQGIIDKEREEQDKDISKIKAFNKAMSNARVSTKTGKGRENEENSYLVFDNLTPEEREDLGISWLNYDKERKRAVLKAPEFKKKLEKEWNPLLKKYGIETLDELDYKKGWSFENFLQGYRNFIANTVLHGKGYTSHGLKGAPGDLNNLRRPDTSTSMIDWDSLRPELENRTQQREQERADAQEAQKGSGTGTGEGSGDKKESEEKKSKKDGEGGMMDEYLNNMQAEKETLESLKKGHVDYAPSKREVPVDALLGLGMAIEGNRKAKQDIPLRDEQISQAVLNITNELKKRSEQGLPPEVEAEMKSKLADQYQAGIESIVSSSGGNRALVLGNLGQLEANKVRGLMQIQVQDYLAKERAFDKYSEAQRYINEFDTRREIANHGIEYQEAKMKQMEGKQLAQLGMKKFIDDLAWEKKYGPGSPYDIMMSAHFVKTLGFNPKAKDTGEKGTKSYYEASQAKLEEGLANIASQQLKYMKLTPDQKDAVNRIYATNASKEEVDSIIDRFSENPNLSGLELTGENYKSFLEGKVQLKEREVSKQGLESPEATAKLNEKNKQSGVESTSSSVDTASWGSDYDPGTPEEGGLLVPEQATATVPEQTATASPSTTTAPSSSNGVTITADGGELITLSNGQIEYIPAKFAIPARQQKQEEIKRRSEAHKKKLEQMNESPSGMVPISPNPQGVQTPSTAVKKGLVSTTPSEIIQSQKVSNFGLVPSDTQSAQATNDPNQRFTIRQPEQEGGWLRK